MYIIKPVPFTLVSASEPENDAPVWASATTYGLSASVIRNGNVFVSTIAGNVGLDPDLEFQELEGARWLKRGATNVRRFFDNKLSSGTSGESPLVLEVEVGARFNAIALMKLEASRTTVEVITGTRTTVVGVINSGPKPVDNWWDWLNTEFFANTYRKIFPNASGFAGSCVRITLEGINPKLGELVIGTKVQIGTTKMDGVTELIPRTLTTVTENAFGDVDVVKRATTRNVKYSVIAPRQGFEAILRFLEEIDGVKVATYATENEETFVNYGLVMAAGIPAELPEHYTFEIDTQGVS